MAKPYLTSNLDLEKIAWNVISGLEKFTADDLHVIERTIQEYGRDKRVIGALLTSLEKQGKISKIGYVKSSRKECHFRPVLQWQVNEA